MLKELKIIERECLAINANLQYECEAWKKELEERKRLGLTGEDAIRHYNEWMDRYGLYHLIVK